MELDGVHFKVTADTGQLERAEAEVQQFSREADDAQKSVDKFGNELKQADKDAGRFIDSTGRMREKTGDYVREADKATQSTDKLGSEIAKSSKTAKTFTSDLSGLDSALMTATKSMGVLAGAAGAYTVALANNVKEQQAWANAVGVSLQTMQAWGAAAQSVGRDVGFIGDVFKDANEKIGDFVATGGGEAKDVFEQLNIQAAELKNLSPDQQLLRIAEGLENVQTQGEKLFILESLANDASLLLPLLEDNARGLRQVTEQAERLGVVISDADAAALREVSAEWTELTQTIQGFGNVLATQYASDVASALSAVSGGIQSLTEFVRDNGDALQDVTAILAGVTAGYLGYAAVARTATGVTLAFNAAIAANPMGLLVRGLALAAGGLAAYMATREDVLAVERDHTNAIYGNIEAIRLQGKEQREAAATALELKRSEIEAAIQQQEIDAAQFQARVAQIAALRDQMIALAKSEAAAAEAAAQFNLSITNLAISQEQSAQVQASLRKQLEEVNARLESLREANQKIIPVTGRVTSETSKQVKTYRDLRGQLDPLQGAYNRYYSLIQDIADSSATAAEKTELMAIAYAYLQDEIQGLEPQIERVADQADPFADAWEEATKRIDDSFAKAWEGAFDSFESFADSIMGSFKTLLANLAHQAITKPILISMGLGGDITGGISGSSGGGGYGGLLNNAQSLYSLYGTASGAYPAIAGGFQSGGIGGAIQGGASYIGGLFGGSGAKASMYAGASKSGYTGAAFSKWVAGQGGGQAAGSMSAGWGAAGMAAAVVALPFIAKELDSFFGGDKTSEVTLVNMSDAIRDVYEEDIRIEAEGWRAYQYYANSRGEGDVENYLQSDFITLDRRTNAGNILHATFQGRESPFGETAVETPFGMLGVGRASYIDEARLDGAQQFLNVVKDIDEELARNLSVQQIESISESLADWVYDGGGEIHTVVEEVGRQLQERLNIQLSTVDEGLSAFVTAAGEGISTHNFERFSAEAQIAVLALSIQDTIDIVDVGIESFKAMSVEGENTAQTIIRTVNQFKVVDEIVTKLGMNFSDLGNGAIEAADNIIQAAGGLDQFAASAESYYQNFYTEAERFDKFSADLTATFEELGYSLPTTREGFRAIVEGLDLTTEAGQEMYATLLNLNPVVAQYINGLEAAADQLSTQLSTLLDDLKSSIDAEKEAIVASSAERIAALELEASRISAVADAEGDRYKALIAAEKRRIDEVRDAYRSLSDSLGDQIDGISDSISGLEQVADALVDIMDVLVPQTETARRNVYEAARSQVESLFSAGSIPAIGQLEGLADALDQGGPDMFRTEAEYLRSILTTANQVSALSDRVGKQLSTEEQILASLEDQLQKAEEQYDADKAASDALLDRLGIQQESAAEFYASAIDELKKQIRLEEAYRDAELSRLDDMYTAQQAQVHVLLGIDSSIKSVNTAVNMLQDEISSDPIFSGYGELFGRNPESAGYEYWSDQLASGAINQENLLEALANGARGADRAKVPGFADGGTHSGGLRIVGERGPELEYTGPSRIMNNNDLMSAVSGGANTASAIKDMEQNLMAGLRAIEKNTREIKQLERRWDQQGLPEQRSFT